MKKTILSAMMLFGCFLSQAQINYESTGDYAKLYDITYDATVQNKIYARTLANHVVVSSNQGSTWQVLFSHPSNIDNLKLVNNNTAIAFSAQEGIFVMSLTTNEIVKFYEIPATGVDGAGAPYISDYSIYGTDNTTALVNIGFGLGFENFGKTFYSGNGSTTWNEIYYTVENSNIFIEKVAIAPNDPQKLYLTRGNGNTDVDGGLFISTDAGENWTEKLAGVVLSPITFRPSAPNEILVGTGISFGEVPENIYKSTDGGDTWTVQAITFDDVTLNNIVKIVYHPTDANKIIALEENEIISTTDGGTTWTNQVFDVDTALDYYYGINASFDPFDANRAIITTDFYPQVTTDYGATLSQIKAPFNSSSSVSVAQTGDNAPTHLYYNSQGGYIIKDLETETATAHDILNPNIFTSASNQLTADPVVPGRVFIYHSGGFFGSSLSVSTDNGATSTPIFSTFGNGVQKLTVDPANSNIVYIVIRSDDNSSLYKFDFTNLENVTNVQLVTPGEIYEEPEEGQPAPATGVITGLIISETNSNNITIAKQTEIYNSTDGGATWTEVATTGLSFNTATDIILDVAQSPVNKNNIILSSNLGLFTSTDGGVTWTSSLPDANARKVIYSPLDANIAAAVAYSAQFIDASFMVTRNNGLSWTKITPEDINYIFTGSVDFAFGEESLTAYIATADLGVMSYVVNYDILGTDSPQLPENNIVMYPNPASSVLNIAASGNNEIKNTVIYSLAGQKVIETTATSINVSALSSGIYIVKSTTANGASYSQKLVKE